MGFEGGYKAAPYLSAPTPKSPSPSSGTGGGPQPSFPLPTGRSREQTRPDTMMMPSQQDSGGDSGVSSGSGMSVSAGSQEGFTIDTIGTSSQEAINRAMSMSGYTGKAIDKVFGMVPSVSPVTGLVTTSAPSMTMLGAGPLGAVMGAVQGLMSRKQEQAAIGAAQGKPGYGLVSINGQTVAVVNGNLYGNLPEGVSYVEAKKQVNAFMSGKDSRRELAGKFGINESMSTIDLEGRFSGDGKTGQDGGDSGGRDTTGFGRDREDRERGFGGGSSPFAKGGRVHMANGDLAIPVGEAGFVDGPPENFSKEQTVADSEKGKVQKDSFVINAPAVEVAGSDDIRKMILEAYNTAKEKGLDIDNIDPTLYEESVDVALSKGEVVVPPVLVKIIGLDRLRKINNRGKKEVDNRQQNMRKGGFIEGYATGDLVSDIGEEIPYDTRMTLPKSTERKFKKFLNSKKSRGSVEKFIDSMTDVERLAVLGLAETTANKDSVESMMAVGQVALNRAASNRPDFKNVNDLKSVMKQRSNRGTGSKMFQYDGLEPTKLRERIKEVVDGTSPRGVSKVLAAAENLTNPEYEFDPILPFDVMFYTAPNAPLAKAMESNPMMQYYTSLGGHDYYSLLAAPESP